MRNEREVFVHLFQVSEKIGRITSNFFNCPLLILNFLGVNKVNRSIIDVKYQKSVLAKLTCSNYGYDCDFVAEGEIEQVIEKFKDHTENEHGIDYSKEALMHFILRKTT